LNSRSGTGGDHERAAFAEPLCLHAANQAGQVMGRRVLVTGADAVRAFELAADRSRAMKVQIAL
jgi:L-idonate 5-dehydrogenase